MITIRGTFKEPILVAVMRPRWYSRCAVCERPIGKRIVAVQRRGEVVLLLCVRCLASLAGVMNDEPEEQVPPGDQVSA